MNDLELLINFLARISMKYEIRELENDNGVEVWIEDGKMIFAFHNNRRNRQFNYYEVNDSLDDIK